MAVVAAAVAVGLLLMAAWGRVSVELHDRREFRRFERERLRATWDQDNPLFRSATTTTVNPNYLGADNEDSAAGTLQ